MALTDSQRADLAKLVPADAVVLFMKGNRRFPQCGFSATVVGILDRLGAPYQTVNILDNPSVREGMKEFSSWPTFPQLYVKGEFVGGCDIVRSLDASGELARVVAFAPNDLAQAAEASARPSSLGEPRAPRVTVTPAAASAFAAAASDAGDDALRLEIDEEFRCDLHFGPRVPSDVAVSSSGVTLSVDASSVERADGITIDFVQGPRGGGFRIANPSEPPRVRPVEPKALKDMLDRGEVVLYDVRPDGERAVAKIADAIKLDSESQRALLALPKDTPVALHCHHGVRSRAAAEQLIAQGFTRVYNLEGGIEAWSTEVDPSVPHYGSR